MVLDLAAEGSGPRVYDAQAWRYVSAADAALAVLAPREFTIDSGSGQMYFGPTGSPPATSHWR